MESLTNRRCVPCHAGTPRLGEEAIAELLKRLGGWAVAEGRRLTKSYQFADFRAALAFVNLVGRVAEDEGHHPDVAFGWGYARLEIYTHAIGGLSESDFVLAAKIDALKVGEGESD